MGARGTSYAGIVATRRAVEAARACDLDVGGLVFRPDGEIRVLDARVLAPGAASADEFAQWESKL